MTLPPSCPPVRFAAHHHAGLRKAVAGAGGAVTVAPAVLKPARHSA